jgi:hypothetical protein
MALTVTAKLHASGQECPLHTVSAHHRRSANTLPLEADFQDFWLPTNQPASGFAKPTAQ